ncbi:helix-turn-helix domain-containing protein [Paenibacillus sp. HJGM_3]|uniref:AraC family transcriptional regulator n=1 Tax=Paenibacillus sp. HJGM_3 TaxID=3379816 RepID=UPI003859E2A9
MSLSIQDELQFRLFQVQTFAYESRTIRDYTQPFTTLSYVVEGELAVTVGEVTRAARTGDVMIHRPHIPFSLQASRSGQHRYVNLDIRVQHHLDFFQLYPLGRVVTLRDAAAYGRTFQQLESVWHEPDTVMRHVRAMSLTLELVSLLIDSEPRGEADVRTEPQDPSHRFHGVIRHMVRHIGDKLTNKSLAQLVHLHPTYFQRAFRAAYGVSPMEMLRRIRLRRARQLLEDPQITLESIARTCGFYDASHLSHLFLQEHQLAPGEYRKRIVSTKTGVFHTMPDSPDSPYNGR